MGTDLVCCRGLVPVLSLIFLISFSTSLQLIISVVGMNNSAININGLSFNSTHEKECLALLQLSRQYNLSTNCNCTIFQLATLPCNGSCSSAQYVAGCAGQSVHELHLSKMGLQGNLSWLANFKHLKLLDVSFNNLSGSLPSSLWKLGEVTHVNLSFNNFNELNLSDENPAWPNSCTSYNLHLKTLDFSHNQISGPLPQHLCTCFPNLTQLSVNHNHLTGYANLSLCDRLEYLDASFNRLTGPLLEDLAGVSCTMKFIDLHGNYLINGSIPRLSGFSHLTHFNVSYNNLSGPFAFYPDELPSSLSRIDVSHNNLQVGLNTSTIQRIGLSFFWPNKACKACLQVMTTPSPSPSPYLLSSHSASKLVHKKGRVSKITRLCTVVGITTGSVGAVLLIAVASCILLMCLHKHRPRWPHKQGAPDIGPFSFESQSGTWIADVKDPSSVPVVIFTKPLLNLTFVDLIQATKSFNQEFEVGDGSGLVYACVLPGVLRDNVKVAIKVVEDGHNLNNEAARTAFTAMGELKHENLVPLLGYCIVGEEKLLIYKHMEGRSLEDVLHAVPEGARPIALVDGATEMEDWSNMESWPEDDFQSCGINDTSQPCLDWKTRHNIALGVARALAYLHNGSQQPIVHGAVSSACILMDVSVQEARLASYGGAWGLPRQLTAGYVAPECRQTAQMAEGTSHVSILSLKSCRESVQVVAAILSPKCDVYSMGVVLLELVTGRHAVGDYGGARGTLVAWVRRLMKGKTRGAERAVDPRLLVASSDQIPQLMEMMKLGYLCTADSPSKRPSMQQVVGLLKDLGQS